MLEPLLQKQANAVRMEWGLTSTEPIRLKSLLQKLKVVTVFQPLSDGFSGMAIKAGTNVQTARFMLVNSRQSLGKQHFTICHELYHLFIQQQFDSQMCRVGLFEKKDKEEYRADWFASYLLLPEDGLLENIPDSELEKGGVSLKTVLHLEHFFSCSRRALLYRLQKMKLITAVQHDAWISHVKRSALEHGYQVGLYEPGNEGVAIGDYGQLAKQLFDSGLISQSHYYQLLADFGIDLLQLDADDSFSD